MGSYSPGVGLNKGSEGDVGASVRDAEGNKPSDPGMILASSDKLQRKFRHVGGQNCVGPYMSPNRFSVRTTPFNFLGLPTMFMAAVSTN